MKNVMTRKGRAEHFVDKIYSMAIDQLKEGRKGLEKSMYSPR
jgi:hypothetical protein